MARDVLAGRIGLREAVQNSAHRDALSERASQGFRAVGEMSQADRAAAEEKGRRQLDVYQEEIDEEHRRSRAGDPNRPGGGGRHMGRDWRL